MSSVFIANMAAAEKDFVSSIASGLLTLGGVHAPLKQTHSFLLHGSENTLDLYMKEGILIPGWGSAFCKGGRDPLFDTLDNLLFKEAEEIWLKIQSITKMLHDRDKMLWPNAACYTAAVCIATDYPIQTAGSLLIEGRLQVWTDIYLRHYNPRLP